MSRFQRKAGIENCDAVRLDRFRESDILRHIFERVVAGCMVNGLVKGEGFAVDAIVMEANASRYHGKAPDELTGPMRSGRSERRRSIWRHWRPKPDRKRNGTRQWRWLRRWTRASL